MSNKKEFYQFKEQERNSSYDSLSGDGDVNVVLDKAIEDAGILLLNGYQQFISNFMSFNETNDRLLLMHSTGVGKTITSLYTAINQMNTVGGNVFIIGFSKSVFRKELMSRPEFGFVSKEEVDYMKAIKDSILKYKKQEDKDKLKDVKRKVMLRLSRGSDKGRLYFIGYKMLSSKLFIKLSRQADLESIKSKEDIQYMIDKKWIKTNSDFIQQAAYSFIVCDEVHNLYNSYQMNSWGVCLKYLLDEVQAKVLFLSATPVNNRPEKIVSVINLLSRRKEYKNSDLFYQKKLTEKGEEILRRETKGKISFLVDRDIDNYPESIFNGEKVDDIEYIKVVECHASDLHKNTIKELYAGAPPVLIEERVKEEIDGDVKGVEGMEGMEDIIAIAKQTNRLPLEGKYRMLNDMVMPSMELTSETGIYTKEDILYHYSNISQEVARSIGLVFRNNIKSNSECQRDVDGDFLKEGTIGKYSSKYEKMLEMIRDIFSNGKGKTFIYHNYVQGSGTCIIKNILKRNGALEHGEHSSANTRCSKCYRMKMEHGAECRFKPLTFIYATGYVSKYELEYKLDLFNSNTNASGEDIGIILGSQAVKESYDFKAVRNIIVAYMPDNISTLIQILGRAIRKNSHQALDKSKRKVFINILITSLDFEKSFEHSKYAYKTKMFRQIKEINKILIQNSIDLDNNYNINYGKIDVDGLYSLPFVSSPQPQREIIDTTWKAYYYKEEVLLCRYIIKRLLIENYPIPITYEKIKTEVMGLSKRNKSNRLKINRDTSYISEHSIKTALYYLSTPVIANGSGVANTENGAMGDDYIQVSSLFKENYVYMNGVSYVVKNDNAIFFLTTKENYKVANRFDFISRGNSNKPSEIINVNKIVNSDDNIILERNEFIEGLEDVRIEDMDNFIQTVEPAIHASTVEFVVDYFNTMWLKESKWSIHEQHDSLVKLLFFYNKFNIVIFANYIDLDTEKDYAAFYKKGIIKKSKLNLITSSDSHYKHYQNVVNSTNASIEELENILNGYTLKYYKYYKYKDKMLPSKKKVKDFLIPIGHYFHTKIRILSSSGVWRDNDNFNKFNESGSRFRDNKSIIGFMEKDKSGFRISFKLRLDNKQEQISSDSRKTIVGSVCEHFEKEQLIRICSKLGIKLNSKEDKKKHSMCDKIKIKLIEMELSARKNESNVRYFKFYWE